MEVLSQGLQATAMKFALEQTDADSARITVPAKQTVGVTPETRPHVTSLIIHFRERNTNIRGMFL